ncbi:MAG: hypothetical protein ISR70_00600 [Candidatus Thioglobus sp.]|nr:hypothetical protein [Candidatus Thioglobus pontius]MBL6976544.1 hypothetical protein [Candidatus Thioglobus sp.]MBL6984720.1 hypothetical protein [Candidatus Thioglobus sp.]
MAIEGRGNSSRLPVMNVSIEIKIAINSLSLGGFASLGNKKVELKKMLNYGY